MTPIAYASPLSVFGLRLHELIGYAALLFLPHPLVLQALTAGLAMRPQVGSPRSRRPIFAGMNEPTVASALTAQDAAEALIALSWPIRPYGVELDHWRIGDLILTGSELIGLATRRGIRPASERVQ